MDHKQSRRTPAKSETGPERVPARIGFSARLLIAVSIFAVTTIGVYFSFVHRPIADRLAAIKENEIRMLHRMLADQATRTLDQLRAEVEGLADQIDSLKRTELDKALLQAEAMTTLFEKFSVLDRDGRILSRPSTPSVVGADRSTRAYFTEAKKAGTIWFDDVRRFTAGLSLSVSAPIRAGDDAAVVGFVVGHMELTGKQPWLCRTDERFARSLAHEAFLLSPSGQKAAQTMGPLTLRKSADLDFSDHPIRKMRAETTASKVFHWRGQDWFGLVSVLEPSGWRFVTQVDRGIAEAEAFAAIDGVGWIVALSFLGLLALTVVYAYRVGRPIRELTQALAEFGQTGSSRALPIALARGEIGRVIHAFNDMLAGRSDVEGELKRQQAELRDLAAELSRVEQRTRREIAGELHDHISQDLAATKIRLELMRDRLDEESREILDVAIELLHGCITSTSQMTNRLAQPAIEQLGLIKAVDALVASNREQYELDCRLECEVRDIPLDPMQLDVVYRGVSELLHNVVKHAQASIVRVKILVADDELFVEVGDDGRGFTPETRRPHDGQVGGYGLFGLSERIRQFGGAVRVESAPGQGCLVTIRLPIREAGHSATESGTTKTVAREPGEQGLTGAAIERSTTR